MRPRLLSVALVLVGALALAQEPPPPPVEAPPSPEYRLIEPRADEVVRKMSALLQHTKAFALEAEEAFDDVPEHQPRRQLAGRRHIALRRPDHLASTVAGDALHRSVWFDGKTFTALDEERNVYASMELEGTIDGALDTIFDRAGFSVALADFLYADPYARLTESAERGVYLGIHEAAGVPCHHVAFEAPLIDWQLWVEAGAKPLPRKLVIAYKSEEGVPQYSVTIRKWNLAASVPDALFKFEAPEKAVRVDPPAFLPAPEAPAKSEGAPVPASRKEEVKP